MANDLLYKASLHLGASPQNKRSSLLYKIPTVGNRQQPGIAGFFRHGRALGRRGCTWPWRSEDGLCKRSASQTLHPVARRCWRTNPDRKVLGKSVASSQLLVKRYVAREQQCGYLVRTRGLIPCPKRRRRERSLSRAHRPGRLAPFCVLCTFSRLCRLHAAARRPFGK
jgi:hypothetical protein